MSVAINWPFTFDYFGVLDITDDAQKIYEDRVLTLLSTNVGQRPMLPNYGTNMGVALFENENSFADAARQAIRTAITTWIPNVSIDSVVIGTFDDFSNEADITINLILPGNVLVSVDTTTAILNYDGTVSHA
jgi:hypothetical protein